MTPSCPLHLCPCLRTVKSVQPHSVSFFHDCSPNTVKKVSQLFSDNLCPTLAHVPSKYQQNKLCPAAVSTYSIQDNSPHYKQWYLDVIANRTVKTASRNKNPDFKRTNPGMRCLGVHDDALTHTNTQANQQIKILCVAVAVEVQVFLSSLKKRHDSRANQLGPLVDSGASRHAGNCYNDVLTFLPTSFRMHPAFRNLP